MIVTVKVFDFRISEYVYVQRLYQGRLFIKPLF